MESEVGRIGESEGKGGAVKEEKKRRVDDGEEGKLRGFFVS